MGFKRLTKTGLSALAIFLLLFYGCSPQGKSDKKTQNIVVWHWMNDRQGAFDELAEKYKSETGITVEFKLFSPPDIYAQKVIAGARAGRLPEIFGILGEKRILASFAKAGHILNLTPYMKENDQEWKNRFYPQALDVTAFSPADGYELENNIFGVPIDITVMEFIYNRKIMEKAGFDPDKPPETFEDFITKALAAAEKTKTYGFVCGWGEGWLLNALAVEWAMNLMGEKKFFSTIKGDVPYTDPQWIEVFSYFQRVSQSGILAPNITTMINKEAEDLFARQQAAFSFNGTWAINVYDQLNPDLDYAFFPLPRISYNYPVKIWGGAGSSFMVNSRSANKTKAVNFLKWITLPEQQAFLANQTNNLPAVKGLSQELPPMLKSLLPDLDMLTHPNVWPANEDSRVIEAMNTSLQQIVMGLQTPQEAAERIQRAKERAMRR